MSTQSSTRFATRVHEALLAAKKALAALGTVEAAAVGFGLLDSAEAGYVTAALGAATTAVVYGLNNEPKPDRS